MAFSRRFFIFGDDGHLWRLPRKAADGLARGYLRAPAFAGQRWKVAEVVLETDGRRPIRVAAVTGTYWYLDNEGGAQRDLAEGGMQALETSDALWRDRSPPGVVSLANVQRRRWERRYRWQPRPPDIDRLVHYFWPEPGTKRERAASVEVVPFG